MGECSGAPGVIGRAGLGVNGHTCQMAGMEYVVVGDEAVGGGAVGAVGVDGGVLGRP